MTSKNAWTYLSGLLSVIVLVKNILRSSSSEPSFGLRHYVREPTCATGDDVYVLIRGVPE